MELEPGIDYWVAIKKYRVRIHRKRITYKVGVFEKLEDAIEAKRAFLEQYEITEHESAAVPQYSKEWFKREHAKQMEKFKLIYSTPTKGKPMFITLPDNYQDGHESSTDYLRLKQSLQNDGYE